MDGDAAGNVPELFGLKVRMGVHHVAQRVLCKVHNVSEALLYALFLLVLLLATNVDRCQDYPELGGVCGLGKPLD